MKTLFYDKIYCNNKINDLKAYFLKHRNTSIDPIKNQNEAATRYKINVTFRVVRIALILLLLLHNWLQCFPIKNNFWRTSYWSCPEFPQHSLGTVPLNPSAWYFHSVSSPDLSALFSNSSRSSRLVISTCGVCASWPHHLPCSQQQVRYWFQVSLLELAPL